MSEQQTRAPKVHLNVGGPRGWTTACGIESSSFVDQHLVEEHDEVDCRRCLQRMPALSPSPSPLSEGGE